MNYILVPVRNGLSYTRDAVADCLTQDIGKVQVWIINNGSTDGTSEWVRSQREIGMTCHPATHSVAESWNLGLRTLFAAGAPYVLVINNDVRLKPETYRVLVESGLRFATGVGVSTMEQFNAPFVRSDREHPDYSCYLIRRECWEKVGPFDENFKVAFYEDNDYHVRMWRAGIRGVCIGIPFWHFGSATLKGMDASEMGRTKLVIEGNKEWFRTKYGCLPGTPEYEALFSEKEFGVEVRDERGRKEGSGDSSTPPGSAP